MKKLLVGLLLSCFTLGLSGCTPPMPPEVRISLEEQQYNCEPGTATVEFEQAMKDLGSDFSDAVTAACPEMNLVAVEPGKYPQIVFSSTGSFQCQTYVKVPFAVDGALIIVNEPDLSSLNLDLATASKIFDGSITSWNDPAIAELNPDQELPDVAISIFQPVASEALDSMRAWARNLNVNFDASELRPVSSFTDSDASKIKDNQIAIFPYSINMEEGLIAANIVETGSTKNEPTLAESSSLASASTQWVWSKTKDSVDVSLDPTVKPTPPQGIDVAPAPYQAIYPVFMGLCGEDNLATRAVARFLLRQDSQGTLAASNYVSLPEAVRIASIEVVAKGLPKIKVTAPVN